MVVNKKVKLSEGEALKNKDSEASDKKVQIWIPKSTIEYEEEKLLLVKLSIQQANAKLDGPLTNPKKGILPANSNSLQAKVNR